MSGRHTRRRPGGPLGRVVGVHRAPLVAIAVVTLLAALLAGSVLSVLGALATAGTRADLDRATATDRDLQTTYAVVAGDAGPPATAQTVFDGLGRDLDAVHRSMPGALRAATGPAGWYAATGYLVLDGLPSKVPASVSVATDPAFTDVVRFTEGRAPRPARNSAVIEVAVSRAVATAVGWRVGDARTVDGALSLRLVGVYQPLDRHDPTWGHVPTTLRPATAATGDGGTMISGTAFAAAGSFGHVADDGRTVQGHAWFPVRTDTVTAAGRPALVDGVRRFRTTRQPLPSTAAGSVAFSTGLPEVLAAAVARDATVGTLAAALGSGPAGALVALGALLARLVLDRAEAGLRLLGARGASDRVVRSLAAGLVATAAVPGAAAGGVLAVLVQSTPLGGSTPAPLQAGVGALLAAVVPCAAAAALAPTLRVGARRPAVRPVVEAAVLVATAAAVVVTTRNGVTTSAPGGSIDPLAAVLPLLLAASGVVVVLRLLPVVLDRLVSVARRRRGVAMLVGVVTAARSATAQAVPLVVAVIGIAVALFATVVGSTLEDGVAQAARRDVAADIAVSSVALDPDQVARIAQVPGVAAAVGVSTTDEVSFDTPDGAVQAVVLVADPDRLATVQRDVPGALPAPAALRSTRGDRVPVVASRSLAQVTGRDSSVLGTDTRVVATAPDAVPFTLARRWVLVDSRTAEALTETGSVDRVLVRTAPGVAPDRVAADLRHLVPSGTVETAAGVARTIDADPRVPGTRTIAVSAAVLGGVLGVGTLAVAGLSAGASRRARTRLLGVFGTTPGESRRLVVAETLPLLVAALVTGTAVAVGVVATTLPSADLRSFTGAVVRPTVAVDAGLLVGVSGGLLVALAGVLVVTVRAGVPTHHRPPRRNR
jgi:putative ABC transport system permease protein